MIGRKLSHYQVEESLGAGGMGEVYRARDLRLGRDVAIKILPPDRSRDEHSRLRFQREAMAASALNHPNIITIYEINSEGQTDFIAMELVRGTTLSSRIKRGPLALDEAVGYARQISDALGKAHAAGIVHRDLKPGNVMTTDDGWVKVLDFGLAKFDMGAVDTQSSTGAHDLNLTLSTPGAVTGTIAYMSPEQARGESVDARSDIFSFGIVLFEMLSGQLPFTGPNAISVLHNLHFSPPRNLPALRPDAPPALADLVNRMLEKSPEQRPTIAEVAAVLRAITGLSAVSAASWPSAGVPAPELSRANSRKRMLAGAAVVVLVCLCAGAYYLKRNHAATAHSAERSLPPLQDAFSLYKRGRQGVDHYDRPNAINQAIRDLEQSVALDGQSAAAFAALSEAYYVKNRDNPDPQWMKQTAQNAHRALELAPDLAASHIAAGIAATQAKHVDEAEKQFGAAADLDPKNNLPYQWLGHLYDRVGKTEAARRALDRALQLNPGDWRTYMELAFNRFQTADYANAAANWEHALKLEPDNPDALESLGGVYHLLGRDDDGAAMLQRALEIKPDADTYTNLGTIRFYQGRYQDAVGPFEKAVALGANQYGLWGNLADAYRWAPGGAEKSKQAYQQAVQLIRQEIAKSPQQEDLRATLAMYLAKYGDGDAALQELSSLEPLKQKAPAVLYTIGITYEICHRRDQALNYLEASLKAGQSMADLQGEPELASLRADPRYHLRILNGPQSKP